MGPASTHLSAPQEGHAFHHISISGGKIHMGDVYSGQRQDENVDDDALAWQARPRSRAGSFLDTSADDLHRIYSVPRTSRPQFTGRQSETQLIKHGFSSTTKLGSEDKHKIIVLLGLGGSGKTQVCLRFAETNRKHYWGVFWIDGSTRANAEASFAELGRQAGRGSTFSAGKFWLSECTRPWLLILDNFDDPDLDVSEFFPTGNSGNILISTRYHDWSIHATSGTVFFRGMEPDEAIDLLLKSAHANDPSYTQSANHRTIAGRIVATLGYLAIAVDHAGATIRRKIYTLEEYLIYYLGHRQHLRTSFNKISPDEVNVVATWEIPFQRIEQRDTLDYQDAVALMNIFAFLHFESISKYMIGAAWSSTSNGESISNVNLPSLFLTGSLEEAERRLRSAIGVLSDHSIIDYDEKSSSCSLHPVVHEWARSRIADDAKIQVFLRCTLYLLALCSSTSPVSTDQGWRTSLKPHIDACLKLVDQHCPSILMERQVIDQAERLACFYEANGSWHEALSLLEKIVRLRTTLLGKWNEDTLRARRIEARTRWNLFDIQSVVKTQNEIRHARWFIRPSIRDWFTPLKPDHLAYCIALDDLTPSLWLAGQMDLSKRAGERALQGFMKRLGPDDTRTWNAMFNLGRTYRHLGRLTEAHQLLSNVVRRRKSVMGLNHPDTLMVRNELGMNFWARGGELLSSATSDHSRLNCYLAIAERMVSNVVKARKLVLGAEHAYTLWSENDLSKILCDRSRASEAVQSLSSMIPIVARTLGEDHVGMHMTKGNLGRAYLLCERWQDAENIIGEILRSMDVTHRDWTQTMLGYIRIQVGLENLTEAESLCRQILQNCKSKKEQDTSQMRVAVDYLSHVYHLQARPDELAGLKSEYPTASDGKTLPMWIKI